MKYDDASWHYGGDFPTNSPEEFGATHIALFMKWCFLNDLASEHHLSENSVDFAKLKTGKMTGTTYFLKHCDGKLTDEDLTEVGARFTKQYYDEDGRYFDDYMDLFGKLLYVASEENHDFDALSNVLERRYRSFLSDI